MRKIFLLSSLIIFFTINSSFSQLLVENFSYPAGDTLTTHGWNITGTSTTNPITVTSPGLSYTGYDLSGIGNAASLVTTGQDINKQYTDSVTSGSVYASFMVNVSSAQSAGDYFIHLGVNPTNTFDFFARTFVRLASNGNLAFGISKSSASVSNPVAYSDSIYTTGTTYLLVIKYELNAGTTNDTVSLFINPVIGTTEPLPTSSAATTQTDAVSLGTINLRQGTASNAANVTVDGIRVGTSWASAVVPVELVSFAATVRNNSVYLNWVTATEINNKGFEVERRISSSPEWEKISFVEGNGNSTDNKFYSYTDANLSAGKYIYRLKQIDYNGAFEFSNEVEANISIPGKFELSQNYPNPFNPNTNITFNLAIESKVTLQIFNLLGEEVDLLINSNMTAGNHKIDFNAGKLNSGVYFYKLTAEGIDGSSFSSTKKMTLMK
jgi:hypothetical protein